MRDVRMGGVLLCVGLTTSCHAGKSAVAPTTGKLDPPTIQRIVRANFGAVRRCYREGLRRNAGLHGRVHTLFVIERDGHVSLAVPVPTRRFKPPPGKVRSSPPEGFVRETSPLPDVRVALCVARTFQSLHFPPHEGKPLKVAYPLTFSSGP